MTIYNMSPTYLKTPSNISESKFDTFIERTVHSSKLAINHKETEENEDQYQTSEMEVDRNEAAEIIDVCNILKVYLINVFYTLLLNKIV